MVYLVYANARLLKMQYANGTILNNCRNICADCFFSICIRSPSPSQEMKGTLSYPYRHGACPAFECQKLVEMACEELEGGHSVKLPMHLGRHARSALCHCCRLHTRLS